MQKTSPVTTTAVVDRRFAQCMPFVLQQEDVDPTNWSDPKNYSDTPGDPGGATFNGIIQSEYNIWRRTHGLPTQSVKILTRAEGYAIYRANYWLPHCPHLPVGLDLQFFDSAVNQGSEEATRILQVALHITNDGIWGPKTTSAVALIVDVEDVIEAFTVRRQVAYSESHGFGEFGKGWTRRTAEIGAAAAKMVAA